MSRESVVTRNESEDLDCCATDTCVVSPWMCDKSLGTPIVAEPSGWIGPKLKLDNGLRVAPRLRGWLASSLLLRTPTATG